jgi:hypothetical protein
MKELVRKQVPLSIRRARRDFLRRRRWKSFEKLPLKEVFQRIYEDGAWSVSQGPAHFYSGSGSHTQALVAPYVEGVARFLRGFPNKPDVVDLGCGDFAIGSQLRPFCGRYVACDVVEPLIEENRRRFESLDVDFRALDITADALPSGEVAFVRQVLQHLSNTHIQSFITKAAHTYRYLIVTEHLPAQSFVPNLDKPAGPHVRINSGGPPSGVVLTEPPFNLKPLRESVLCEVHDYLGTIRTKLYELR